MKKKKTSTAQQPEDNMEMVNEPAIVYKKASDQEKKQEVPGNVSLQELNLILDKAEENIRNNRTISHQEALKDILQW